AREPYVFGRVGNPRQRSLEAQRRGGRVQARSSLGRLYFAEGRKRRRQQTHRYNGAQSAPSEDRRALRETPSMAKEAQATYLTVSGRRSLRRCHCRASSELCSRSHRRSASFNSLQNESSFSNLLSASVCSNG